MTHGQTRIPTRWLVADPRLGAPFLNAVERLPTGSGVLVLPGILTRRERARLRLIARRRGLVVADEAARQATRVHDPKEIRQAGLRRIPLLLLSPLHPTRSHPEKKPLPRMRAAALLRLAGVPVLALGGMDSKRFGSAKRLGFAGWAGIDAWNARPQFP